MSLYQQYINHRSCRLLLLGKEINQLHIYVRKGRKTEWFQVVVLSSYTHSRWTTLTFREIDRDEDKTDKEIEEISFDKKIRSTQQAHGINIGKRETLRCESMCNSVRQKTKRKTKLANSLDNNDNIPLTILIYTYRLLQWNHQLKNFRTEQKI